MTNMVNNRVNDRVNDRVNQLYESKGMLINISYSTIESNPIHYGWGLPPNDKVTHTSSLT